LSFFNRFFYLSFFYTFSFFIYYRPYIYFPSFLSFFLSLFILIDYLLASDIVGVYGLIFIGLFFGQRVRFGIFDSAKAQRTEEAIRVILIAVCRSLG
jgi:hypothetical protein